MLAISTFLPQRPKRKREGDLRTDCMLVCVLRPRGRQQLNNGTRRKETGTFGERERGLNNNRNSLSSTFEPPKIPCAREQMGGGKGREREIEERRGGEARWRE